jgi:hypothetical protein
MRIRTTLAAAALATSAILGGAASAVAEEPGSGSFSDGGGVTGSPIITDGTHNTDHGPNIGGAEDVSTDGVLNADGR